MKTTGEKIEAKFKKAWDKNNYTFSDGESIGRWIRNAVDEYASQQPIEITEGEMADIIYWKFKRGSGSFDSNAISAAKAIFDKLKKG